MKSIRKRIKIGRKYIATFALLFIGLATFVYAKFIHPSFSYADSRYLTATITDDNGSVDFSPGVDDATANFSYVISGNNLASSKIYDVKIVVNNLPPDVAQKKLSVTLPIGMVWVDDASDDSNLLTQLDQSKGTNGIEKIAIDHEPVLGYAFDNSGTRTYHISEGSIALTVNVKIKADDKVNLARINDAVVAKLEVGNETEEAHLNVDVPSGASLGGHFRSATPTIYVGAGTTFSLNKEYLRTSQSNFVLTAYSVIRLITKIQFSFHVEGKATMQLTSTDSQYSLDSSDSENGNYAFTYTPNKAVSGNIAIPYSVTFAEDAEPGETVVITATGETTYWQPDGSTLTVPHRNSQTATYYILPNNEDVTIGRTELDPTNSGSVRDRTIDSSIREGENMTGALSFAYVNNRGAKDSTAKRARLTFDTSVLGVMMVRLPCSPNGSIESVHIITASGVEKDVTVNARCNAYGMTTDAISYANLGIDRDDYLAELEYDLGVVPAATQLRGSTANDGKRAMVAMGKRLDETREGLTTMEIFDKDHPENTTGVAKITSRVSSKLAGIELTSSPIQVKNAGETLNFSITASSYGKTGPGYAQGAKTPIIYLRSEAKDASGNFLPLTNIKVTNGSARGDKDITALFGQITVRDTETARVYILDGRNITDGSASITSMSVSNTGQLAYGELNISFSIETNFGTPSQSHDVANMLFIQDPEDDEMSTHANHGDPFNISIVENSDMISVATTNYYQIRGSASIGIENAGKHVNSDTWLTWSEGSNPITIGSASGSAADVKVTLLNNSGVEVSNPTIVYSPVPKKDQNWGSSSYDDQPFEFSTALVGPITNPNSELFTIAYGKNVTPSDDGSTLDAQSDKFTTDVSSWTESDWEAVNCIRIMATDIPANQPGQVDTYDFIYRLKVIDSTSSSDGAMNTWRPLYFQRLTNSDGDIFAGWYKGSYVSIKLADGTISGELFIDANENGKKDTNENTLKESGWKIDLYDRASNRLVRSTETDANGRYNFIELAVNTNGYYINVTNKHPIDGQGATYLFTPKGDTSNTGAYNSDNQAEGDKNSTPIHSTAYIGPISPSQTNGEATYNIGLVEYEPNLAYSGSLTFEDQNNQFNTRPSSITLTATANDSSSQTIDVATNQNSFTLNLPKYNNKGERLTYTISAPELTNYSKQEQTSGQTYNLTYTQKTATLTVHHYLKDSTTRLIPDKTSTVFWGQTYTASEGAVSNDYELDSIAGETSGTVSGDISVSYYYIKKRGTVTTHYYIKNTTTKIANDTTKEYEYGENYTTSPLEQIPDAFADYELVSAEPANYKGIIRTANIDIIYYYQKKDPQVDSSVIISGPETVNDKSSKIAYEIDYSAHILDYIGSIKLTIVTKLPYPINEAGSDLDGGIYNANDGTLTWIEESSLNTYTDGGDLSTKHHIALQYEGVSAKDLLLATTNVSIKLDGKDSIDTTDSVETSVRTPARITFRFVDQAGNEIRESEYEDGYVGDEASHVAPEIPGYRLVEGQELDRMFREEEHVETYTYEKLPDPINPNTFDSIRIVIAIFTGTLTSATLMIIFWIRRKTSHETFENKQNSQTR